jgi:hypothetical protein
MPADTIGCAKALATRFIWLDSTATAGDVVGRHAIHPRMAGKRMRCFQAGIPVNIPVLAHSRRRGPRESARNLVNQSSLRADLRFVIGCPHGAQMGLADAGSKHPANQSAWRRDVLQPFCMPRGLGGKPSGRRALPPRPPFWSAPSGDARLLEARSPLLHAGRARCQLAVSCTVDQAATGFSRVTDSCCCWCCWYCWVPSRRKAVLFSPRCAGQTVSEPKSHPDLPARFVPN